MKKSILLWQTGGFVLVSVLGTLLHFLFDWTGGSPVAAVFSAVNESIWEHMKLLFYPMVVFAVLSWRRWGKAQPCFWQIKLRGILLGLVLIPVLYYSYTGILGVSADWFNVTIFFLVALIVFRWETVRFQKETACQTGGWGAVAVIVLLAVLFTVWTFRPPEFPLFQDPITGTYGFMGKS